MSVERTPGEPVTRRFTLVVAAMGLLLLGEGCSAFILHQQYAKGLDSTPAFLLDTPRREIEGKLGQPVSSRALPDGGRVDTYEYSMRPQMGPHPIIGMAAMSLISLGLIEVVSTPMVLAEARKNARTVTLTYGPGDQLLKYGPPPPYGPADDVVDGLSHRAIRERCRSEHPRERQDVEAGASAQPLPFPDYPYHECVVRRLAIWGIE